LKVVAGNPGRRPLNADEPVPAGDLDEPPEWMTDGQKVGWRYAIENAPHGLLKRLDRSVLAVWVIAEDLHRDAAEKVARYGSVIKTPVTGVPVASPYLGVLNKQATIMMRAAAEMGFTPSARSRVKAEKAERSFNPFADLKQIT
jgi:P27 family predicted phage terminase small subunit